MNSFGEGNCYVCMEHGRKRLTDACVVVVGRG